MTRFSRSRSDKGTSPRLPPPHRLLRAVLAAQRLLLPETFGELHEEVSR